MTYVLRGMDNFLRKPLMGKTWLPIQNYVLKKLNNTFKYVRCLKK